MNEVCGTNVREGDIKWWLWGEIMIDSRWEEVKIVVFKEMIEWKSVPQSASSRAKLSE